VSDHLWWLCWWLWLDWKDLQPYTRKAVCNGLLTRQNLHLCNKRQQHITALTRWP
jgi:hypothetical protein